MAFTPQWVPTTVGEVFDRVLADAPASEGLVTRSGHYTYAQLDALVDRASHVLAGLGVRAGDRVAASLPNDTDVIVAFHAAMRLGAIWVGVNRALAAPEKAFILDDCDASVLLCDAQTAEQVATMPATLRRELAVVPIGAGDAHGWEASLAAADDRRIGAVVDPDAPAGIAYTSGTTGHPKGALHSQRNLCLPGVALVASRGYGPGLRKGDCLPLTILNMQVLTTLLVAQAGGCSVIMDRTDAPGVADWVRRERVTTWNGPPALIHNLSSDASVDPADLATLDEVLTGGADCPEAVRAAFEHKFGRPVLATYGLSEAPTIVTIDGRDGAHVAGASGRPLPHLDLRIITDDGEVAVGETGEVCLGAAHGGPWAGVYRTMLGYHNRSEATVEALRDGLLHTGDIGFLDEAGFLHLRDRKSLLILRGGANVYPAEVERVLHAAPGVAACAVVGIPDERLGERVVAAVEVTPGASVTADALGAHCAASLARYKVPERFVFVDGFARNSMGKILRRELATLFEPSPPALSPVSAHRPAR